MEEVRNLLEQVGHVLTHFIEEGRRDKVNGKREVNANPAACPQQDGVDSVSRSRIYMFHKQVKKKLPTSLREGHSANRLNDARIEGARFRSCPSLPPDSLSPGANTHRPML